MIKTSYVHNTPSSKILINIKAVIIPSCNLNEFSNKTLFNSLCEKGCPNYGHKWSCPPYSPAFTKYSLDYDKAILILMNCNLDQFDYIKTEYMKVKASNSILKAKIDILVRNLESKYDGLMISNGSCRLCKPCNCKKELPCKKPKLKRYSMESLGLDVGEISKRHFKHELLWYKNKTAPLYSTVLSCILTNAFINENDILYDIENLFNEAHERK